MSVPTGFARGADGHIYFVGARLPEDAQLAPGFARDSNGITRYVGGPVDNYAGAGSEQAALARWEAAALTDNSPEKIYERLRIEHDTLIRSLRGIVHELYEHPYRLTRQTTIAKRLDKLWEGC
jgi:hypothetical protein